MCCIRGICILAPGANVSANLIFHPVNAAVLLMNQLILGVANKKLKYYEIIDSADVRHEIQKRSLHDEGPNHRKEMTLSVLGRYSN